MRGYTINVDSIYFAGPNSNQMPEEEQFEN